MHSMDWQAILSSKIMTNYLLQEQEKLKKNQKQNNTLSSIAAWEAMENDIKSNEKLKNVLIDWQNQFRTDPNKTLLNPKLSSIVLSLNLED